MGCDRLIRLDNVYKIYRRADDNVHALGGVTFEVGKGEFVAITGTSGSGKSTLMNILGCLDTPTSGNYWLDGENVQGMKDRQLSLIRNRMIGFVFQSFNLLGGLTAAENIELPLIYRRVKPGERALIVREALRRVGLIGRENHRPGQMSGGQQQRTAIARAIAAKPPLILADEPTGNLDTNSGQAIMNVLSELHTEGRTIVLITHDSEAASHAQRRITIEDGRIRR